MKPPKIIFEDSDILVIDKPVGKESKAGRNFWLVHRLDKDTSGLMVIAKNKKAYENLSNQFRERKVVKKYLAVVHGVVAPKGRIQTKIARDFRDRRRFRVSSFGKESRTDFKRLAVSKTASGERVSFLEVVPKTGRTHQIRVHLAHIGHPVVGDRLYLPHRILKKDRRYTYRMLLHAFYLSFVHPKSGERVEFKVTVPKVFWRRG